MNTQGTATQKGKIEYTYDGVYNITSVKDGSYTTYYSYDRRDQLVREDDQKNNRSIAYQYDTGGNMTWMGLFPYTTPGTQLDMNTLQDSAYGTFNPDWKDQLLSWGNIQMTYDAAGNMVSRTKPGSTTDTMSFTWTQGKKLSAINRNGTSIHYYYDHTGTRYRKTVGSVTTEFCLAGNLITSRKKTSGSSVDSLYFLYDSAGNPATLITGAGVKYHYVLNAQNDVIGLVDSTGEMVVRYWYDSWGKCVSVDAANSTAVNAADRNPFRYRSYYYDDETGFYYVGSRYYDPEIRRFISADELENLENAVPHFSEKNLYAYCDNNPVGRVDGDGKFWHLIAGAAIGIGTQYIADVVSNLHSGKSFLDSLKPSSSIVDYGSAAIGGALAATGVGSVTSAVVNAALGGTTYLLDCDLKGEKPSAANWAVASGIGLGAGFIGGSGANTKKLVGITKASQRLLKTMKSPAKIAMYVGKIAKCRHIVIKSIARTVGAGVAANYCNWWRRRLMNSAV